MPIQRFSHLGLCVTDLERSRAFYCQGLGFQQVAQFEASGEAVDTLLALRGTELHAVYLERDGLRLELLHYRQPPPLPLEAPVPMNRPGFTHLSLRVQSLDSVLKAIEGLGGRRLESTRTGNEALGAFAIFALDPDGTRIELVEQPGDPSRLPGEDSR